MNLIIVEGGEKKVGDTKISIDDKTLIGSNEP